MKPFPARYAAGVCASILLVPALLKGGTAGPSYDVSSPVRPSTTTTWLAASRIVIESPTTTTASTTTTSRAPVVTRPDLGPASWFNAPDGTCAHRTLPVGTVVFITRLSTGARTSCRVDQWGPADTSRVIDLSMDTFEKLAGAEAGLIEVVLQW